MITYKKASAGDVRPALDLALRVFMAFEAAEYEPGATCRFKDDIVYNNAAIQNWERGMNSMYVAMDGDEIIGVIGEKGGNGHINLVFVDGAYHRGGIATELMNRMICDLKLRGFDKITLFSSTYGLPFYLRYGFTPIGGEQRSDGFTFIPMAYEPNEIWDVLDQNGNKTGRYAERGRMMRTGDYHLVVHVWKHNDRGEWLIDQRKPRYGDDGLDGKWETTGGAAVAGDDSLNAALRETKEELGIDLDPSLGTLFKRTPRLSDNGHTWFEDVWVFKHNEPIESVAYDGGEVCCAMWATVGKIRDMMASGEFVKSELYPYFDELAEKYTPYYLAYERRYQAVYAAGATLWGHSADDDVLINTLTEWIEKHDLRGKKVVEYACGEGSIGVILSKLGCIYHGVDIAPSAVSRSKQKLTEYPDASVSMLDMVNERVDGLYDAAIDSMGLHMIVTDAGRKQYLGNVNAALKDDAPALFFRESYRADLKSYQVGSIKEWIDITGEDYEKSDIRHITNDGVAYTVNIPLVPARAKNKADYIKEMNEAGFVVESFVEMDASDAISHSATLYVRKGRV